MWVYSENYYCNFIVRYAPLLPLNCLLSDKQASQFSVFISELKPKLCDK